MARKLWTAVTRAGFVLITAGAVMALPTAAGALTQADTAPTKRLSGPATQIDAPYGIAVDSLGRLYVSNAGTSSITAYGSDWAAGDTPPIKVLSVGSGEAEVNAPFDVAFDSRDRMYVSLPSTGTVSVYAADWINGAEPLATLDVASLGHGRPLGIAFDSLDRMYVTADRTINDKTPVESIPAVVAFAADWVTSFAASGTVPQPIKVLVGPSAELGRIAYGVAFDSADRMYVTTGGDTRETPDSRVLAFQANWPTGDTAPFKVLEGPSTGLNTPLSVDFGYDGTMYVTNFLGASVTGYAAGWATGDTAPIKVLRGFSAAIETPVGLTVDDDDNVFVSVWNQAVPSSPSILMYAPTKSVTLSGSRPQATKVVLSGATTGIRIGSTVTPYVKIIARGQKFKALTPVKVTGASSTKGQFRIQVTGVSPKRAYQAYVVVDGVKSRTVTLAARP